MRLFEDQIRFIENFEKDLFTVFQETIKQFDFVIKDFIVNKQLFQKGIDGNSERLPGYNRMTIRVKLSKSQPVDRTTLHDTQKFVSSIEVNSFIDRFEISSNVSYDKYIIKRYGIDVLKPTDDNLREFINNFFMPNFKVFINKNLKK